MAIKNFIQQSLPLIDKYLADYLKPTLKDERQILEEAMWYSFASGKRIRALLALASHLLFDQESKKILPFCCALELLHTYTLIHDDLPAMDDDDYRRGQLTSHKQFGEAIAILAGDSLHTYAFEILAKDLPHFYSSETTLAVIARLAYSLGKKGVIGGQVLDMRAPRYSRDYAYLKKMHAMKTGALIAVSLVLPLVLLERTQEEITYMETFGDQLGLLFQIIDDILDVTGTRASLGKTTHKDTAQNKFTYVSYFGLAEAKGMASEVANEAKATLRLFQRDYQDTALLAGFVDYVLTRLH